MATRTEFPGLAEGDGMTGGGNPAVLAAKLLVAQVLAERNRVKGTKRAMLTELNGRWDKHFTKDLVVAKQYLNQLDKFGKINPWLIGKPAWTVLWSYAKGKLGGRVNDLVNEELRRRRLAAAAREAAAQAGDLRARAAQIMIRMANNGHLYRYAQLRPFPYTDPMSILLPKFYNRYDCSSTWLGCVRAAGGRNPLRKDGVWDGLGHTGSMWVAGVSASAPRVGDAAFYGDDWLLGYWRPQHVALVLDANRVGTFGSNPPRIAPIRYRSDFKGFKNLLG